MAGSKTKSRATAAPAKRSTSQKKRSVPNRKRAVASAVTRDNNGRRPRSIVLEIDDVVRPWLTSNPDPQIRNMTMSERDLVAKACELSPGYTPHRIAREGLHYQAQRLIAMALSKRAKKASHGVRGSADARLEKALEVLDDEGLEISPSRLGNRAIPKVNIRTAKRFLERRGLWPLKGK